MSEDLSDDQKLVLHIIVLVCGAFSLIGSGIISITYLRNPVLQNVTNSFVFKMSLLDSVGALVLVASSTSELIAYHSDFVHDFCRVEAVFVMICFTSVSAWTTVFSLHCLLVIVYQSSMMVGNRMKIAHGIIWTWCGVTALIPLVTPFGRYGHAGADCFLKKDSVIARQVLFYIPLYIMLLVVVFNYVWIMRVFHRASKQFHRHVSDFHQDADTRQLQNCENPDTNNQASRMYMFNKRIFLKMGLYPVIFILIWVPNILNRMYEAYNPPNFILSLIQAFCLPSQGWANFLVYGYFTRKYFRGEQDGPVPEVEPSVGDSSYAYQYDEYVDAPPFHLNIDTIVDEGKCGQGSDINRPFLTSSEAVDVPGNFETGHRNDKHSYYSSMSRNSANRHSGQVTLSIAEEQERYSSLLLAASPTSGIGAPASTQGSSTSTSTMLASQPPSRGGTSLQISPSSSIQKASSTRTKTPPKGE